MSDPVKMQILAEQLSRLPDAMTVVIESPRTSDYPELSPIVIEPAVIRELALAWLAANTF